MVSSKQFRIAFYCSSNSWGGLEMNTLRHAVWMKERGHKVLLLCVENSPLDKASQKTNLSKTTVNRNKKNFDLKSALNLKKILKNHSIDFVWFRDKRDLSTIGLAKTMSLGTFKVLYHQAMQIGVKKTHLIHTLRFKKIDAWISPLHYLKQQIKSRTKFKLEKVHVIPLAVDINRFEKNGLSRVNARNKFKYKEKDIVVGIIGRIDPHKAQQFVKDVVANIRENNETVKLLIVGNKTEGEWEDYYQNLKDDIEKHHSSGEIQLLPFMDDVKTFYNAIDVFVMSSAKETFGMVTIEAMLSGKKIVGSNTCGTLELLNKGEYGYYFVPNNKETLKAALIEVFNDPVLAEKKASEAKEYALLNFDHRVECERIEKVLIKTI